MPSRPLVFVSGLTFGDYLLWNWSLGGNHAVLALVAGLTLPPLAIVCAGLIALHVLRLALARTRRGVRPVAARTRAERPLGRRARRSRAPLHGAALGEASPSTTSSASSSGKLAA